MDFLPLELVEEIALYLDLEDVVACSNVSLSWEHAFNSNRIWKRFLTIDTNYFEKQTSKMNYSLSSAPCQVEPCQSKELALKELFIKNNFESGKYYTEEINVGALYVDCIKETVDGAGNHWLFVSLSDGDSFEGAHVIRVWNVNQRPLLHTWALTPLMEMSRPLDSQMKIFGDRLFHVNENFVLIYKFAPPRYELKFVNIVELSMSGFPAPVFISLKMICLPNAIVGFAFTNVHIDHRVLPTYEVWSHDGKSVSNNFEEIRFLQNVGFTSSPDLLVRKKDQNSVVVLYEHYGANRYQFVLKVFDCGTHDYTDLTVEKHGKIRGYDVFGNVVILFYSFRDQSGSVSQTYIESISMENGSSLFCSHLESEAIDPGAGLKFPHGLCLKKVQYTNGGDLIAINNKVLSVYRLTDTGLTHVSSFELTKKDGVVRAIRKNFIVISYFGQDSSYEMYNYETGKKMYIIELPKRSLEFSFKKKSKSSFPTNLIAYSDTSTEYAQRVYDNSIFMISFW